MGLYTNIKRISSDDILDALRSNLSESVSSSGTIESLNEEFEVWLDCLIDEGYDLSEYTLDEMHEIYENYDNHNLVIEYLIAENFADDSVSANTMIEYMSEEWLDNILESKKWIQKAIKKKGALSKQLGVPESENIPSKMLRSASKKKGKLGKRARLALTLRKFH